MGSQHKYKEGRPSLFDRLTDHLVDVPDLLRWLIRWSLIATAVFLCFSLLFVLSEALEAKGLTLEDVIHFKEMVHHLFAVSLEFALVLFLIEHVWRKHEKKLEIGMRREQLKLMKIPMFKKEMRNLFLADFQALEDPKISFSNIQSASPGQLKKWKLELAEDKKGGPRCKADKMPQVIYEYVNAAQTWEKFIEIAIINNFTNTLLDIVRIEDAIAKVNAWQNGDKKKWQDLKSSEYQETLIYRKISDEQKDWLAEYYKEHKSHVDKIWGDGIRKFIDFAIDLKGESLTGEDQEEAFQFMMKHYVTAEQDIREEEQRKAREVEQRKSYETVIQQSLKRS